MTNFKKDTMKTIRLYQNTPFTEGNKAELDSDNSHHLNKVLRFRSQAKILPCLMAMVLITVQPLVQDSKKTTLVLKSLAQGK